jgi:hypothetical protein
MRRPGNIGKGGYAMSGEGTRKLCDLYVRHARLIGALYCIVPTVGGYAIFLALVDPIRPVYWWRLGVSLILGGFFSAIINKYSVSLWLAKHRSPDGPATAMDGVFLGTAVGLGNAFIPSLTCLIKTNHPQQALTFIVCSWVVGIIIGAVVGGLLATMARDVVPCSPDRTAGPDT